MKKRLFTFPAPKKAAFVLALLVFTTAQARVFDMGTSKFGTYLKTSFAPWASWQVPFSQSSGTEVNWSDGFANIASYEFGVIKNTSQISWRFGIEIVQPANLTAVSGKDSGNGTVYYSLDSTLSVINPKIGVEFNLKTWPQSRLWMYFDYGLGNLTLSNTFRFTAAGLAQFPTPGADFREEIKGNVGNYSGAVGFESLLNDTTTWCLEVGYRMMDITPLSHNVAATTFQGPVTPGSPAKQNDGTTGRQINMTGPYASFQFRIWVY
jgi:hypothetical protein